MRHDAIPFPTAALLAALSCLCAAPRAQAPTTAERPVALVASAGVTEDELGRPIAIGPDWECEFDADGARFLPVLGGASPLMDLRLRAASVRRGDTELPLAAEVVPTVRGLDVCYRRGSGIVERFTATPGGLEHSLSIAQPIGTRGDLRVRVALDGHAAAHGRALGDGTHLFATGRGGVLYGTLIGIDAAGRRCAGSVRLVENGLEWHLPAHFVDGAQWPLVLDPLIGSNFQITVPLAGSPGSPYETDAASDLAYDVSTNSYLLVWQRRYGTDTFASTATTSIRGQRLDGNGAPLGGVLALSVVDSSREPRVANVNPSNRFAVTWVMDFFGQSQLRYRAVDAATGSLSSSLFLAGEPTGQLAVGDVAGETSSSASTTPRSWVVYVDRFGNLQCILVDLPAGSTSATVAGNFTLQNNATVEGPIAICSGPSEFGRLGVVAARGLDIVLTCFNRSGVLAHASSTVYTHPLSGGFGSSRYFERVAIDGGGSGPTDFVIAVESARFGLTPPTFVVWTEALGASSQFGTLTTSPPVGLTQGTFPASPSVAWRNGKAYVTYRIDGLGVVLHGLDPKTCATCESPLTLMGSTSLLNPTEPAVCIAGSTGTGLGARGLVAWTANVDSTGVTGPLFGRRFEVFSSLAGTTSLGGGCGGGGSAQPTGMPYVGNTDFGMQLLFADPGSLVAVFNWNSPQPLLGCGPCQWLPFGGTITTLVTNGTAQVPLPIPCDGTLSGVQLDTQWTVWRPGVAPCPIVPDFALSNVLRLNLH